MDTIDQIFASKKTMPHFIKDHFSFDYFKNHNGDEKLKEIYERSTIKCGNCIHTINDLFNSVTNKKIMGVPNVLILDETLIKLVRKGICNFNCK